MHIEDPGLDWQFNKSLAAQIRSYWLARGFEVALEIVPMMVKEGRPIVFGIKSDMIGGLPVKKQAYRRDAERPIIMDVRLANGRRPIKRRKGN